MSISHNLLDHTNLISCFDPVSDIPDGTTIGKSYLIRKIFENFLATHPTAKEITNASPTPAWLQGDYKWGSYTKIEPSVALNRSVKGDHIRFYFTDDPGLTQSPPGCIVYAFSVHTTSADYYPILELILAYKVSGSAIVVPTGQPITTYTNSSYVYNRLQWEANNYTVTKNDSIPRIFIWSSSNAFHMSSWSRVNGSYTGGFTLYRPTWTGYTSSGVLVNGQNVNAVMYHGTNYGWTFYHPIGSQFETLAGSSGSVGSSNFPTRCQVISSTGRLPNEPFVSGSSRRIITSKMAVTIGYNEISAVSGEIEGILLANGAVFYGYGSYGKIWKIGSSNYISIAAVQDGMSIHRMLFKLD